MSEPHVFADSLLSEAPIFNARNYVNPCLVDLISKKEQAVREALDELLPDGWTNEEVASRSQLVRLAGSTMETFVLDGNPILEFHDLESSMTLEGDKYVMRATQKYRRLYKSPPPEPKEGA